MATCRFLVALIGGQLAGASLAGLLSGVIGWRGVFALSTTIAVLALGAVLVGFRGNAPAGRFDPGVALVRYRGIVANPRARALFLLVFVEATAVFGGFPYLAPLLEARNAGGAAEAGIALAGFAVGGLVYSAAVAWLLRRLGLTRMLAAGGVICAGALLTIGVAEHWAWYAAAMLLLGLGYYMLHNSFQTQVTEVAPDARASAVAIHAFSFFLGQSLGVVLFGLGLRAVGQVATLALSAALILGVGLVAAQAIGRTAAQRPG